MWIARFGWCYRPQWAPLPISYPQHSPRLLAGRIQSHWARLKSNVSGCVRTTTWAKNNSSAEDTKSLFVNVMLSCYTCPVVTVRFSIRLPKISPYRAPEHKLALAHAASDYAAWNGAIMQPRCSSWRETCLCSIVQTLWYTAHIIYFPFTPFS